MLFYYPKTTSSFANEIILHHFVKDFELNYHMNNEI